MVYTCLVCTVITYLIVFVTGDVSFEHYVTELMQPQTLEALGNGWYILDKIMHLL